MIALTVVLEGAISTLTAANIGFTKHSKTKIIIKRECFHLPDLFCSRPSLDKFLFYVKSLPKSLLRILESNHKLSNLN